MIRLMVGILSIFMQEFGTEITDSIKFFNHAMWKYEYGQSEDRLLVGPSLLV
jgi:hypothetical protein